MKIIWIALAFIGWASAEKAMGAEKDSSCRAEIQKVITAIERAESKESLGQIEPCIPAKSENSTTNYFIHNLDVMKARSGVEERKFSRNSKKIDNLLAAVKTANGNICGTDEKVKAGVNDLAKTLHGAVPKMDEVEKAVSSQKEEFEFQYGNRESARKQEAMEDGKKHCKRSSAFVKGIIRAFESTKVACSEQADKFREISGNVEKLAETLESNCDDAK